MITNYSRPHSLQEALTLLAKPNTRPLGGGTWLNRYDSEDIEVVDLQGLQLNDIQKIGNNLEIGACVTLQQLLESQECPQALQQAIRLEAGMNIRSAATVAGSLVTCNGRSAFGTVMLAMDVKLTRIIDQKTDAQGLGDFLILRPQALITKITLPMNVTAVFEGVARSPVDTPIVCAAVCRWPGGRTRLALGGWGKAPVLAMDGTEADGIEAAARNSYKEAADEWASSEYRADVAATLSSRCLKNAILNI